MVVEYLFKEKWVARRPLYSLLLGVMFTIIAYFTSIALFGSVPHLVGITTILFIVILAVYGVNTLFEIEEKKETQEHGGFFKEHEEIIDFFLYFFVGIFLTFFLIAIISPAKVFSEDDLFGRITFDNEYISQISGGHLAPPPPEEIEIEIKESFITPEIISIFKNNLYVMLVCFFLSLFYSSGAIFLITLNASIFASALANALRSRIIGELFIKSSFMVCNLGIMFIHMIPEVVSYGLSAIAGGVLSKAFYREKILSHRFKLVLKDSIILLSISIFILFFSAILEMKVSRILFTSDVCWKNSYFIILAAIFLFISFIFFELFRKKKLLLKTKNL